MEKEKKESDKNHKPQTKNACKGAFKLERNYYHHHHHHIYKY